MKDWKFKVVSDEDFYQGMRDVHIPENLIQEFKMDVDSSRERKVQSSFKPNETQDGSGVK